MSGPALRATRAIARDDGRARSVAVVGALEELFAALELPLVRRCAGPGCDRVEDVPVGGAVLSAMPALQTCASCRISLLCVRQSRIA